MKKLVSFRDPFNRSEESSNQNKSFVKINYPAVSETLLFYINNDIHINSNSIQSSIGLQFGFNEML